MQIGMSYGRRGLALNLPDDWKVTVISKKTMPLIGNPTKAIAQALTVPVASPPLAELAGPGKKVCILIWDITRPVPNHLFLRPLIDELTQAGVVLTDITVLVATGLHRPNEGRELAELVGDAWVLENVRVENHFARDGDAHLEVGITSRGTVARLDRRFAEADIRIATGLVEPHFMAGYPLDETYYQTVKGMVGGMEILSPGGNLFVVSEISEGMGSPEYVKAQEKLIALGADGFLADIRLKTHAAIDEWQTEMQLKPMRRGKVHLFTKGLSRQQHQLTGVDVLDSKEELIRRIAASLDRDKRIAVIPEGPYILPFLESQLPGGQDRR